MVTDHGALWRFCFLCAFEIPLLDYLLYFVNSRLTAVSWSICSEQLECSCGIMVNVCVLCVVVQRFHCPLHTRLMHASTTSLPGWGEEAEVWCRRTVDYKADCFVWWWQCCLSNNMTPCSFAAFQRITVYKHLIGLHNYCRLYWNH